MNFNLRAKPNAGRSKGATAAQTVHADDGLGRVWPVVTVLDEVDLPKRSIELRVRDSEFNNRQLTVCCNEFGETLRDVNYSLRA